MEPFFTFLSGLLFVVVAGAVAQDLISRRVEVVDDIVRRNESVEKQRDYANLRPEDPFAWERLGDALRDDDQPREAIEAWRRSLEIMDQRKDLPVSDIPQKIRLAEVDIRASDNPESLQQTLETREQVCRKCGALSPPDAEQCVSCNAPLLVEGVFRALQHPLLRVEIWQEARPVLFRFAGIALAFLLAAWLPIEVRTVLFIATIAVVPFWWLRRFGDGG